jgi:hypothetical protein
LHVYPWNTYALSYRPDITLEDIKRHPEIDWIHDFISYQPGLTIKDVENNKSIVWNWNNISANATCVCSCEEKDMLLRRHMAAFKIQTYWRKVISTPTYDMCKKRLLYWEFDIELRGSKRIKSTHSYK